MTGAGRTDGPDATTGGRGDRVEPQQDLSVVIRDLVVRLPATLPEALALPRFRAGAEALERLQNPEWLARGIGAFTAGEAERLAAVARLRWAALAGETQSTT